jgi:phage major head subunit gpT-like protein
MLINQSSLRVLFEGFNTSFNKGFEGAKSHYKDVAMMVPSTAGTNAYGWLGQFPKLREWVGDRVINNLVAHSYAVENKLFENTIGVPRPTIEDDQYGIFGPMFTEMGRTTAQHPDELIFALLAAGFTTLCYDGQNFFDSDHPVKDAAGNPTSVSNIQAGGGTPWFLLDCGRAIKPMLFQTRIPYTFTRLDQDNNDNVFWRDEYIYGVRARANAGLGLWQLAYASKAPLTAENYEAARSAMMELKGDEGRPLGIQPDTLVVAPSMEGDAMRLLNNGNRIVVADNGSGTMTPVAVTNEWANTAKPIVTAWLAA